MTQAELISKYPKKYSIPNRVFLLPPDEMGLLHELSIRECRVFILVTQGSLTAQVGKTIMEVNGPVLVDMLVWEPITLRRRSEDLRVWCLLPNYLFTNESLKGLKPADSESLKDRHKIPEMQLEEGETEKLERHLTILAEALADFDNHYREELSQTYFRGFMLEAGNIVRHKKKSIDDLEKTESRGDAILRNFMKLVWKYYQSEHNVEFYAEHLCISSKHLARVVRDRLGKTPYAVIRDEVLHQAMDQLKYSKKSIQEISSELHFSEIASFCKFFKTRMGISPTKYRNNETGVATNNNL